MTAHVFVITRAESGRTVADLLRQRLRLSWSQARRLVQDRRVRLTGSVCLDAACRVKSGQRLEVQPVGTSAEASAGLSKADLARRAAPGQEKAKQ